MRTPILAALCLFPALASCVAVAAVGAGVLIGQVAIEDNVYVGELSTSSNLAFAQTKTTLSTMSLEPIDVKEDLRQASAKIDGATVSVSVETYDLQRSRLRVGAKRYGFAASETARQVFERIIEDLNKSPSASGR